MLTLPSGATVDLDAPDVLAPCRGRDDLVALRRAWLLRDFVPTGRELGDHHEMERIKVAAHGWATDVYCALLSGASTTSIISARLHMERLDRLHHRR